MNTDISELRDTIRIIERSLAKTTENFEREKARKNHRVATIIYWSKISQERQLERLRNTLAIELEKGRL